MQFKRSERVGDLIHRETADIIDNLLKDPDKGFSTVTAVEVTDDLRMAKIFVSCYGSAEQQKKSLQALQRAARFVHTELGRRLRLKFTPQVIFCPDRSVEEGLKIDRLLREVAPKNREEENL